MIEMKVHPVADLFPMMSDDELQDLAADIKAKGLVQAILIDGDGLLLDGRNQFRACEIAGVEPRFESMNGIADPLGFVISLNVKRRNLHAGQRAMAAASAWVWAEKEGKVATKGGDRKSKAHNGHLIQHPRDHFAALFGVGKNYVEQARALLKDDPPAAELVRAGASLKEKHDELAKRQGSNLNEQIRRRKLAEIRPDLADKVAAGSMELAPAEAQAKKEEEEAKQRRWAFTMNLLDAIRDLDHSVEQAAELAAQYDAAHAESRGETISPARLRKVADFVVALADAMESRS